MAQRENNRTDHGHQQNETGSLEIIDIFCIEDLSQGFGVGDATRGGRRGGGNCIRGNHPRAHNQRQLHQYNQANSGPYRQIVQHALAQLDKVHIKHHDNEEEKNGNGTHINHDQNHGQELRAH